jgi:hypothetical protein
MRVDPLTPDYALWRDSDQRLTSAESLLRASDDLLRSARQRVARSRQMISDSRRLYRDRALPRDGALAPGAQWITAPAPLITGRSACAATTSLWQSLHRLTTSNLYE